MPLILKLSFLTTIEAETSKLMKFKEETKVSEAIEEIVTSNKYVRTKLAKRETSE